MKAAKFWKRKKKKGSNKGKSSSGIRHVVGGYPGAVAPREKKETGELYVASANLFAGE